MDFGSINWLAVIVCVLVSFAVGFVYFSPKVFFDVWWKALGKTGQPGTERHGHDLGPDHPGLHRHRRRHGIHGARGRGRHDRRRERCQRRAHRLHAVAALPGCHLALEPDCSRGTGLKVWAIEAGNHLIVMVLMGAILGAWR